MTPKRIGAVAVAAAAGIALTVLTVSNIGSSSPSEAPAPASTEAPTTSASPDGTSPTAPAATTIPTPTTPASTTPAADPTPTSAGETSPGGDAFESVGDALDEVGVNPFASPDEAMANFYFPEGYVLEVHPELDSDEARSMIDRLLEAADPDRELIGDTVGTHQTPFPGLWAVVNLDGTLTCGTLGAASEGGVPYPIVNGVEIPVEAEPVERGTITVSEDGSLVGSTVGPDGPADSVPFTMHPVTGIIGRYRGEIPIVAPGVTLAGMEVTWQVITPGLISGFIEGGGASEDGGFCVFRRWTWMMWDYEYVLRLMDLIYGGG